MLGRRSVDFSQEEFELILGLLQKEKDAAVDDSREIGYYESLIKRVNATPAYNEPIVFGYSDLSLVRSMASSYYVDMKLDKNLSGTKLEKQENSHLALANAVFMWLNKEQNLKRNVLFDFVDDTYEFESHDE